MVSLQGSDGRWASCPVSLISTPPTTFRDLESCSAQLEVSRDQPIPMPLVGGHDLSNSVDISAICIYLKCRSIVQKALGNKVD